MITIIGLAFLVIDFGFIDVPATVCIGKVRKEGIHERAYKKIGPFSLKAAPYLEAKNVVIETKEAISEPQKLFSSHVAKIVGQDVKAPVIITELLVVVGSKTNRYENVRL